MKKPFAFKIVPLRECAATAHMDTPAQAAAYWRANIPPSDWYDPAKEALVVLILNTRRRIIGHNLVGLGLADSVLSHPREVSRPAIVAAGSCIVLLHNHPSGDPTPSEADIKITRQMIRAGELLKIELLDHVIIGAGDRHASLKGMGYFA